MSAVSGGTLNFANGTLPWSVIVSQLRPCLAARATCVATGYIASLLYWLWTWWSPASHR